MELKEESFLISSNVGAILLVYLSGKLKAWRVTSPRVPVSISCSRSRRADLDPLHALLVFIPSWVHLTPPKMSTAFGIFLCSKLWSSVWKHPWHHTYIRKDKIVKGSENRHVSALADI